MVNCEYARKYVFKVLNYEYSYVVNIYCVNVYFNFVFHENVCTYQQKVQFL